MPTYFGLKPPLCGHWEVPARPDPQWALGPEELLSGVGGPGVDECQGSPVSTVGGLRASALPLPSILSPSFELGGWGEESVFNQILQKHFNSLYNYHPM